MYFSTTTFLFTVIICFGIQTIVAQQTFIPGNTYHDATGFVEYRPGTLPIIISVPHGGSLSPDDIPDRTYGTFGTDLWTKPIGEGIYTTFFDEMGCYPHLIINLLHRSKFDANRDIDEAADGNATVEEAWEAYHDFIEVSKTEITQKYGRGLFLDLHGHGHTIQRVELGYLLSGSDLRLSDADLNMATYIEESSVRTLVDDNLQNHSHAALLRGQNSFGTLLDDEGFPAVPSTTDPFPMVGDSYFSGGYNTQRHGSRDNQGTIDAIQIELNQDARFDELTRAMLIESLTNVAREYIEFHYGYHCLLPVAPKVFLQGAFDDGLMTDGLRVNNLLPTTEPYTALGISELENAHVAVLPAVLAITGNDAIVDWIMVELRAADAPGTILSKRIGLLQRDGDIVDTDGVSALNFTRLPADDYYIAVKHRNHLGVMTAIAVPLSH